MNRSEWIEATAKKLIENRDGLDCVDADVIDGVLAAAADVALETLAAGETLSWRLFGSFSVLERPPCQRWNPRALEMQPLGARRVIKFAPSRRLAAALAIPPA